MTVNPKHTALSNDIAGIVTTVMGEHVLLSKRYGIADAVIAHPTIAEALARSNADDLLLAALRAELLELRQFVDGKCTGGYHCLARIHIEGCFRPDVDHHSSSGCPLCDEEAQHNGAVCLSSPAAEPPSDEERVRAALAEVYKPEGDLWMRSPNRLLNNATPMQFIAAGDTDRVLALIEALATGAHL